MKKFPNKKYQIIYADPPWRSNQTNLYQGGNRSFRKTTDAYPLMTTKELKELSVAKIAADTALLFMWTTDFAIPMALEVMKSWGFRYSTVAFYWLKKYKTGSICFNTGFWTMKSVEQVLLGVRGTPLHLKKRHNVKQFVEAIRTTHSVKPDEVRKRIVQLFGNLSRIELFARQKTKGWDVWGNEV